MNLFTLGKYALRPVMYIWSQLKKRYTSEVNKGLDDAFELVFYDWSKHAPTSSDKLYLKKAVEGYMQNPSNYEDLDVNTQAFIDYYKKRLSEQAAAHNYLITLRADEQAKSEVLNLREHQKTQESIQGVQESIQGVVSRMEGLNMTRQYIKAIIQELPLKQGLEPTVSALEAMFSSGRLHSEGAKQLFIEFAQLYYEYANGISEEAKQLRDAGDNYLAETLEEINKVLTGESEQSLTDVYREFKDREQENEIKVLEQLIEAAQLRFSFEEACDFYERLIEVAPTAEYHFRYARLLHSLNRFGEARQHYEAALKMYQELAKQNPEAYLLNVAATLNNLGILLSDINELKQAQEYYEEALQICRELAKQNPEAYLPNVAATLDNLGNLLSDINDLKQAQEYYEEALQIRRELAKQNPKAYLQDVAETLNNLGVLLSDINEPKQAQEYYEEALQILRELAKQNPKAYLPKVAATLNNLGILLSDINELKQAQKYYEEALQIRRELAKQNPKAYLPAVVRSLNTLAELYAKLGIGKDSREANSILQGYSSSNSEA